MISTRSPKPLDLRLKPSNWLSAYFIALHCIVVASGFLALPVFIALAVSWLAAMSLLYYLISYFGFLRRRMVVRLIFAENHWRIYMGARHGAVSMIDRVECVSRVVLPFGMLLCFKTTSAGILSVPILPDSLDKEQYRRLRCLVNFTRES